MNPYQVGIVSHDDSLIPVPHPPAVVQRPTANTVSLAELRHRAPAKAERELSQAKRAWNKHRVSACVDHLNKAIEIDPEYLSALKDLGIVYVYMNQPEHVISTYQKILKLQPRSVDAYPYIGMAELARGEYGNAEASARRCLDIDSGYERGRVVLGVSLAVQNKDLEALSFLTGTFDDFPVARKFAAYALARLGRISEARNQIEAYLPEAPASDRKLVEKWLGLLPN